MTAPSKITFASLDTCDGENAACKSSIAPKLILFNRLGKNVRNLLSRIRGTVSPRLAPGWTFLTMQVIAPCCVSNPSGAGVVTAGLGKRLEGRILLKGDYG